MNFFARLVCQQRVLRCSVSSSLLAMVLVVQAQHATYANQPIITKQDTFFIPFTAPNDTEQVSIVELYVSGDRGENWSLYQQRGPTENRFSFRAGADGEYWFSIRTVDAHGAPTSRKKHQAQMKVVVDQTPPKFELTASNANPGQVHANWRILDKHCIPESIRFEYKTGLKGPWQALSIHGSSTVLPNGSLVGEVEWSIPQSAEDIFIRAEVKDQADNLTVLERQIASSPAVKKEALPLPAALPQVLVAEKTADADNTSAVNGPTEITNPLIIPEAPPAGASQVAEPIPDPSEAHELAPPLSGQADVSQPLSTTLAMESSQPIPAKTPPPPPGIETLDSNDTLTPPDDSNVKKPDWLGSPQTVINEFAQQNKRDDTSSEPNASSFGPVVMTNQYWKPKPVPEYPATDAARLSPWEGVKDHAPLPPPTPTWTQLPPPNSNAEKELTKAPSLPIDNMSRSNNQLGAQPLMAKPAKARPPVAKRELTQAPVASSLAPDPKDFRISPSRKFHLDYSVDASNSDKVHRVEVWFTDDGGQSWHHHGDDDDRISPYLARVTDDGMYGFRLLVQSREGLTVRPPMPGDPADIWIRVDKTPPSVAIKSATYGRGNEQGKLTITWSATDADLFPNPIALLYSDAPNGPWRQIANELPNTGRYDWMVSDYRVPDGIYLQIRARDRAGNVATQTLSDPIKAEGLAPQGHIRGFRPASHQMEAKD